MNLILCLALATVAADSAWGQHRLPESRGAVYSRRHPFFGRSKGAPVKHLDVALPNDLLASDDSILIHLKDQALWDQENSISGRQSKAALLPSYLKALQMQEDEEETPFEPISDNENPSVKSMEHANRIEMMQNLEDILNDNEVMEEFSDEKDDKSEFFFQLKDLFKQFQENAEDEKPVQSSSRLRNQDHPGVFFNLEDLESQLKETFEIIQNEDGKEGNKFKQANDLSGGVFFSLVEMLKQYVDDTNQNDQDSDTTGSEQNKDLTNASDDGPDRDNEQMFEELKKSNISVSGVDTNGGLFFSLADQQEEQDTDAQSSE